MKRWKLILAAAGATAAVASASVAALSAAAAPAIELATPPPVAGYCDRHTAAMDQMHDAMADASPMRNSTPMRNAMRGGMRDADGGMHGPRGATAPSGAMHMEVRR